MIKLTITILVLLCFVYSNLNAQKTEGIIYYKSKINSKKLDEYLTNKRKSIKNKNVIESLDKVFLYTKSINSTISFSKGEALFVVENKLDVDINDLGQRVLKTVSGGEREYYFNDKNKTYLIKDCEALGECFIFDNTYLEWQLTQETKTINGYKSYKATRSNGKVIAWYTPSIPLGFGPKGEYGLPGLILELEIGNVIFNASKIVLNPKEVIKIEEPKGGKRVSKEEYEVIMDKAKKSVFGN
ncbi:GLPGLI family protein [Polaribacter glomeratus]|nr:GLPGLI family protein [Polaribacter glomeratus]TXD67464.1 GLPGLI family protein [Polaribacter glomeratus]